jgi:50S ribosomal subunit-associated GTPase HflX
LGEIGAAATPQILVLNKADRLPSDSPVDAGTLAARLLADARQDAPRSLEQSMKQSAPAVVVSGLTGEGLATLLDRIDEVIPFDPVETVQFRIPLRDGAAIALLHKCGRVRAEDYDESLCLIEVDAPESLRRRLSRYLAENPTEAVENSVHK